MVRFHLLDCALPLGNSANGACLLSRRNWPIGLLYDCHTSHASLSNSTTPSSPKPPPSLANYFSPNSSTLPRSPKLMTASSPVSVVGPSPFRITVHLKNPPQETLLLGPSVEGCRSCFMHQIKVRFVSGAKADVGKCRLSPC